MDMRSWKKVLLQWITECGFMDRNYFNIEQTDIDVFYHNFSLQHQKTNGDKYKHLADFLKEFYSSFELNFDDENCLSSADYIYVYSLLLHFCCVKHPETVFHEICQRLPDGAQQFIAAFFKELLDTEPITKEALRHAIAEVANSQGTPPRLNESFSSGITSVSVGGLSTASFSRCESPLKTPKRCAGPQRISPSTPKSYLLEERTRELYNLRAQLETERYEKGLLEVQIKQNEDKIQKLNHDHKRLLQQIQDLKNDILVNTASDGCANRDGEENQIQKRLLKELNQKEQEIIKLSDILRTLKEEKALVEEKRIYAEKQIILCKNRIQELDFKVDELTEELEKKNGQIKYLTDSKMELEQFISETRSSSSGLNPDLNASVDCLDSSFLLKSNNTNGTNSLSSPENLGVSVVDVQLREKEHENQLLKEELKAVKREHRRLAKHLTKLTQEFDLPIDSSSPNNTSEESEGENNEHKVESGEESSAEEQISYEEQFNIFNSCMDKIDKYYKTEKYKIKQLEQQTNSLQQENEDLSKKLEELTEDVGNLKKTILAKEKLQQEMEKSKEDLEMQLEKSQGHLVEAEHCKTKLYNEIQSLEFDKQTLNENIKELKNQLELQQKECKELLANNTKHEENEQNLQQQMEELQKEFSSKSLQWQEELKLLNEKMTQQIEDIEVYRKTEQTIKCNYEQMVVQNEELKNEARQANTHLSDIRNELREKEQQLASLGKEISDFKHKNEQLEKNINSLIEQHKQEQQTSCMTQTEMDEQLSKLKEQLNKTELLIEAKQQEIEMKELKLKEIQTKVLLLIKLVAESGTEAKDDVCENLLEVEAFIKKLQEANNEMQNKIIQLQETQKEMTTNKYELEQELQEKIQAFEDSRQKLEQELQEKTQAFENSQQELQEKTKAFEMAEQKHEHELQEKTLALENSQQEFKQKLEDKTQEFDNIRQKLEQELQEKMQVFEISQQQHNEELQSKALEYEDSRQKLEQELQENAQAFEKSKQELKQELQEKTQAYENSQQILMKLKEANLQIENKLQELQQEKETVKDEMKQKVEEFEKRLRETANEYEASLENMTAELKSEKEQHNNKEMELILITAEYNEAKKKLNETAQQLEKLEIENQTLQQSKEYLTQLEGKLEECLKENNKLKQEIETFKQEVCNNALRLQEADKALIEFMELTKEQDTVKCEVETLQIKLQEKEEKILEMEKQVELFQSYEQQLEQLKQQLEEQNDLVFNVKEQIEILSKDKKRLQLENEDKSAQILKEQQDKLMLLSSLEKSTDQLKLAEEEKQQQTKILEEKLQELKAEFENLTLQNTKLQGDLVEREAELRLSLDEQQQEKEDSQRKLQEKEKQLSEKLEELQTLDLSLMEIVAIMENNFNLRQELLNKDLNTNVFNYQKDEGDKNIQKLKQQLNLMLNKQQQLNQELKDINSQKQEALECVNTLRNSNNDLMQKLQQQEKALTELKEQLDNEEMIMEKRVFHEVKRLEEDLLNLEKVNERLANENVKIQVTLGNVEQEFKDSKLKIENLEEESLKLREQVLSKSLVVEKLQQEEKKLQQTLKEKLQQSDKLVEKSKHLELQLKDRTSKLQQLEKEHQETKEKANRNQQKLSHYQQSQQNQQQELKKLQEKLKSLQTSNESLEQEVDSKNKELLTQKNKNNELMQKQEELEQQLNMTSKKLDEMLSLKLNAETKCEQLQSEIEQLKRDLEFLKSQQQTHQEECTRLCQEIDSLKVDKQHLRDEVHENKQSLQRANDNVTQLIQQISSIRLEKEAALEESVLLRKQLEETGKNQSTSETKMKSIMEKSQEFERKLLSAENELKSLKVHLEKSEVSSEKLQAENKKLRDNQEISTKRIEKLALKLGDSQAKSAKLERDNEKLSKTLDAHATTVEALQKEKDSLQAEAKTLKERLSRAERGHEQLAAKVQNLEHLNTSLQQIKQKLEASELDGKTKLNKLEKLREANEEKIRKLTHSLTNAENSNVKLNLEIGALNSQIQEVKVEHNQEQYQQIEELNHKLQEAQELNLKYEEINEKLKIEVNTLKEENSSLNDQLSKASLSLKITSQKCERFATEMEQIRSELLTMRQEKSQIELQHETSIQKLNQFESQNTKLVYERKNLVKSLEQKISHLEEELSSKTKEVVDLQKEIQLLKENTETNASLLHKNTAANLSELEDLRTKLSLAEEIRQKEQQIVAQLRLDNQILHTKYQESKQRALDASKMSEERIKENRLELEGKLEKMKNKMKTLYTEEITKMKTKQEREMAVVKSEMEVLKAQNTKYEEHTRKLSNQIVRLNDNILQHQKENTILSTKLKHLMEQLQDSERNRQRPSSIHVSTISSSTAQPNIGTNLAMEDEEGEVFNNTYLTDLKNGRMSELMSRDVCVEELKYRNSLLPPHLRSTYAAQFDHEFPEDELKDGPHSLDDSMSALLSTTAGGTRKKCTGVTHYKRPGPPTPSKNGGRLSFGGSSEPGREILKESYDTNGGSSVSSSKTPARFNFFASRFSMGVGRDEKPLIKKESDELNLRKILQKPKMKGGIHRVLTGGVGCTSTPRKSKVHYDQRRLLDQLMTSSPSPSPLTIDNKIVKVEKKLTPPDVSFIETPLTALDRRGSKPKGPTHKSNAKRIEAIAGGLRRSRRNSSMYGRRLSRRLQEICTPTSGDTTSSALSTPADMLKDKEQRKQIVTSSVTTSGGISKTSLLQRRLRKKPKREKGARPSLYLRGNIFAKYRTPNKGALHDLNRYKSKKQRFEHFNQGRNLKSLKMDSQNEDIDKTYKTEIMKNRTYDLKNNNYATFNHNKLLGETVIIAKCQPKDKEYEEETFTYNEEDFPDTDDLDYMEDYDSEEEYDETEADDGDEEEDAENDKEEEKIKEELISTQDLEDFDRFIAHVKQEPKNEHYDPEDDYLSQGSSNHFEKLLVETESNAPFEVKHIHFNVSKSSHSSRSSKSHHSSSSNHSHSSHSHSHTHTHSHTYSHDHTTISTATPHLSPNNPTCQLSRTIYGGTIIYNHRLPNINTTYVRKSSIYVKNRRKSHHKHHHDLDSSSCNDVVLITNQTITFVDIMRMWSQMDSSTRLIVCFAILASFTTLLGLFLSFCSKR
ncbi:mushroom body defect isoform 2-T2 [Cochliomyia hominivorax]